MTEPQFRALLTQHRLVIQTLKHQLDQLKGVAKCAPPEIQETFDWEWMETMQAEANRVLMLSEEETANAD